MTSEPHDPITGEPVLGLTPEQIEEGTQAVRLIQAAVFAKAATDPEFHDQVSADPVGALQSSFGLAPEPLRRLKIERVTIDPGTIPLLVPPALSANSEPDSADREAGSEGAGAVAAAIIEACVGGGVAGIAGHGPFSFSSKK